MRAIVLVGGEGTRLRPLSWRTPKQLVPILNRPLIEHMLAHLRRHGVTAITLAMTKRSDAVREALGDGRSLGVELDYAYEETPLGSGGAIAAIAAQGGWDEAFLVCNGDLITDLDISDFIATHRARGAELSLALHEVDDPTGFGVVVLDGSRIVRFVEKPPREQAPSRLVNAGTWLFEPSVLDGMAADQFHRVEDTLFPALAERGRAIHGYVHPGYWVDVGNPEAYRRVNLDLVAGACPALLPADVAGGKLIAADAHLDPGARLEAPLVIGARCEVAAEAEVRASVLWDDVRVGPRAIVRDSVLASGVRVGEGAVIEGAIVAHDVVIDEGERIEVGTVIEPGTRYTTKASA